MLKFLIYVMAISGAVSFLCPETDICQCQGIQLKCSCGIKENLTLPLVLDDNIENVTIGDCETVNIPLGSISHLHLAQIELFNIRNLNIRPFALAGIESIKSIRISNISNFKILPHTFVVLPALVSMTIRNVTVKTLPKRAFALTSAIDELEISDSSFESVETSSLIFENITSFKVSNSRFDTIANVSFLIQGSKHVIFSETTIQNTSNASFVLISVENLIFDNCTFHNLATSAIVTINVTTLHFHQCTVGKLESGAFSGINVTKEVDFSNNRISIANENSVIPNEQIVNELTSNTISMQVVNNSLTCDCDISWLWTNNKNGLYDSILNNSFCINLPNTKLSSLIPILDFERRNESNKEECVKLGKKTADIKPLTSQYSSSKAFGSVNANYQSTLLISAILQISLSVIRL